MASLFCPNRDSGPQCVMQADTIWEVGQLIGTTFFGGSLVLGVMCISLFSTAEKRVSTHRNLLRAYIWALLYANAVFLISYFLWYHSFSIFSPRIAPDAFRILTVVNDLLPVVNAALVGGLLVWRCYMVQKALGSIRSRWQKVFWIIPLCLLSITLVAGTAGAMVISIDKSWGLALKGTAVGSNILVDIFATSFIISRLLLHRRLVLALLGKKAENMRHLHIAGILFQSAVINLPVSVLAVVGVGLGKSFAPIVVIIVVTSHSFASVLVIHQVALGRAVGGQREIVKTESEPEKSISEDGSRVARV